MDVVVADVKPFDVIVTRPDGSTHYARLIGFHDAATFRLFVHVVLCPPGEGIRQEHVHEGLLAMVMHPEWGFRRSLYLDNGSEFGGLDKLKDAMALLASPEARTIIRAKPYNASAKPVESNFSRLDKLFTCVMPGYAGKDCMMKKTRTGGRPPAAYPHSFERLVEDIQLGVADLNHTPLTPKHWRGLSPHGVFAEAVEAGWVTVLVDPFIIDAALCEYDTRVVGKECLRIGSKVYPVPGLRPGSRVSIALPWRREADPLYRPHGAPGWIPLSESHAFPADWNEGARESAKLDKASLRVVRNLDRDAPTVDALDVIRSRARKRVQGHFVQVGPVLDAGAELTAVATAMRSAGPAAEEVLTEEQRQRRMRERRTARLTRSEGLG